MTAEVAIVVIVLAGGAWAYVHFSGKKFDKDYSAQKENATQKAEAAGS